MRSALDGAKLVLKIWGNADSVNVQKVLWCCEEIGLAYQRIDAGRNFGVVDTPQFRKLNPNGLVPTIDDDGFVLWESNSILRYLAARYSAGTLWAEDPRERAGADQWMDWSNSTLWPLLVPLFRAFYRTPEALRDAPAIEADRTRAVAAMAILDAHLEGQPYVAGPRFTMADIAAGCAVWRWYAMPIDRPPLASLQRWFDRIAQRAAYRKVVMLPLSA